MTRPTTPVLLVLLVLVILPGPRPSSGADGEGVAASGPASPVEAASTVLPDPLAAGWHGRPVCEALVDDARQRVLRCTFEPGVGHERHFHPPHAGYVLDGGTMRVVDAAGTREITIDAGGTWTSDGVAWHEALNVGETTVRVLLFEPKGSAR